MSTSPKKKKQRDEEASKKTKNDEMESTRMAGGTDVSMKRNVSAWLKKSMLWGMEEERRGEEILNLDEKKPTEEERCASACLLACSLTFFPQNIFLSD